MTLDEWFDVWMDTCKKNCRDSTRQNYRVSYNRIKASLGWRKLSGLNLIVMQQAFNELKTDASRKDSKRILIDMFNKAIAADLLNKNIAKQIDTVVTKDGKPEEPRVLTLEETDWFLEAASHYRNFNEFSLALETGMRIGEILGLKWSGIEGKGRKAPEGYEDLVFVTTKNTPISPRDTTVVMKMISDRIASERPEFEPLTLHTLRHTFATRCIERGMNPKTLQIILGHSSVHITMNLYCHVTEDMLVSEMSKFENGSGHEPRTSCANAHSVTGVAL